MSSHYKTHKRKRDSGAGVKSIKWKTVVFVVLILFIGSVLEIVRQKFGVPVTILDIFLFPISIAFAFVLIKEELLPQKGEKRKHVHEVRTFVEMRKVLLAFLIFFPLGAWCVWEGISSPFAYFSGVKGATHGYTVFAMGLVMLSFAALALCSAVRGAPCGES